MPPAAAFRSEASGEPDAKEPTRMSIGPEHTLKITGAPRLAACAMHRAERFSALAIVSALGRSTGLLPPTRTMEIGRTGPPARLRTMRPSDEPASAGTGRA